MKALSATLLLIIAAFCDAQSGSPCALNGTKIPDGSSFNPRPCNSCQCDDGTLSCSQIICDWPVCPSGSSPKVLPNHCCASCEPDTIPPTQTSNSSCRYPNGTIMPKGASFPKNRCTNCTCDDSGQLICPPPPCPPPIPIPCKPGYHTKTFPPQGWNECCNQTRCVPDTVANTTMMTPTPSLSCKLDNGSTVPNGARYQLSPCTHCTCHRGSPACYVIDCPRPPTCKPGSNLAVMPGKCCPTCQKNCSYKGSTYRSGSKFYASDGCNTCTCTDGSVFCTLKACISPCARVRCPGGKVCKLQQVQCIRAPCPPQAVCVDAPTSNGTQSPPMTSKPTPSVCTPMMCRKNVPCSISKSGKAVCGCNYGGITYKNGDFYPAVDGCNTCFCTNGSSTCTEMFCPHDKCKNVTCESGFVCQMRTNACKKAPCSQKPVCVPKTTMPPTVVPPSCPQIGCPKLSYCRYGYSTGKDGCFVCQCNEAPTNSSQPPKPCPQYRCRTCPYGNVIDPKTGCVGCRCAPPPSYQCKFAAAFACFASRNVTGLPTGPGASLPSQELCLTLKDALRCHKAFTANSTLRGCSGSQNQTLSTVVASVTSLISDSCPKIRCYAGGKAYSVNETFPDATGCNQCYCLADGTSCTQKHCTSVGCRYATKSYKDGQSFSSLDGCNDCSCDSGRAVCSKLSCKTTRYVKVTVKFSYSYEKLFPNSAAKQLFKQIFVADAARILSISEAQIAVLNVQPGSVVVTFAVLSPSLTDIQEQLDEVISSQQLVISFDSQQLVADNIDFTMSSQVGSLPPGDKSTGSSTNLALIIGVSCGAAVVFIVVITVIIVVVKKRKTSGRYRYMSEEKFIG